VDPATNIAEPRNMEKVEHFQGVAEFRLGQGHDNSAHNLLQDIRLNLDILYSDSEILKRNDKGDDWLNKDSHFTIRKGDARDDVEFPAKGDGIDLDFPLFFYQNLYTMNRDVMPIDDEEWVEFEMRINEELPKDQFKFEIPTLKYEDALESYVVKELVVVANDESMHVESVKSMCLGLFDAFEQAHDNLRIARELDRQFVLADLKPHTNNQGKTNWPKNLQGPMREMPTNLKKEMLVTDISFHTLKKHVQAGHKTVDAILKEFTEEKITIEVEVESVEKKAVYQPVRGHGQSRTMQAGGF